MAPTQASAPPPIDVSGHFDSVMNGRAYGWAFTPAASRRPLNVQIVADGEVVGMGRAEHFREDLEKAGLGDGRCMFDVQLSHELFDGAIHSLSARVAETGTWLAGGPHDLPPERREAAYPQIPRKLGLTLLEEMLDDARYAKFAGRRQNLAHVYRLASSLQEVGQFDDAQKAWTSLNKALAENSLGYCKLGECLMLASQPAEALEAFQTAAGTDIRLHWAHLGIANSKFALGQFEEAEDALQVAIALQPQDESLQTRLQYFQTQGLPRHVEALLGQGNRDQAITLLKAALLKQPDNDQAVSLLGDLLCEPIDTSLPGMAQLQSFRKAQRVLDAMLDAAEAHLNKDAAQ